MPMFIHEDGINDWLSIECDAAGCHDILIGWFRDPEFEVEDHEPMRDGWQNRADNAIAKREKQLAAIKANGHLGD